jgi:hypothetical protein
MVRISRIASTKYDTSRGAKQSRKGTGTAPTVDLEIAINAGDRDN